MAARSRLFHRLLPLLVLLAVVLLCGLAASLLLGWTPDSTGLPADISRQADSGP